ncbi:copper amine oxidase N-terminal domain-containing protein [Anaerophilus nitritogenes]|uniref:copper amine oxidase N-terminal domain-containing protein n=1 Tax=Anaerophilus nitritogenes TaxID=2498136 RepID=UPI00101CD575|nr:copper amine oxidase N-terminal domain-containing protein [Anaerophilus nitritogenes]
MKKIIICIFLLLQITIVHATNYQIPHADLSLYCDHDMEEVGYQELMPIQEYVFQNGTKINASPENAQTIIMINGLYQPDIQTINHNNILLVPAKTICETLGFQLNWVEESNNVIIKNNNHTITLKVKDHVAIVNNEKHTLQSAPILMNNTIYVPLRFICETMGLKVKYYTRTEIDLFTWNPVVTIDQEFNASYISEKEAYESLKRNLTYGYDHFEDNYKTLHQPEKHLLTSALEILRKDIENLRLVQTISRYYVFEGLRYTIYVDKYTGTIYFNVIGISFSQVKKADFNDPRLFEYSYMVD